MIRYRYQAEGITKPAPPSLPAAAGFRLRPLIPGRVIGVANRFRALRRALADTGAIDTVFPWPVATLIGASLVPDAQHLMVWRGARYSLRFARVQLELSSVTEVYRWPATVGFTAAPVPYPLLGIAGFFEFFDVVFHGADCDLELAPSRSYPGIVMPTL